MELGYDKFILILLAWNLITFLIMGLDKRLAGKRKTAHRREHAALARNAFRSSRRIYRNAGIPSQNEKTAVSDHGSRSPCGEYPDGGRSTQFYRVIFPAGRCETGNPNQDFNDKDIDSRR